jgi:hypothetical protein
MTNANFQPRPRGRPPKKMTGEELLRRFGHKTLVWCDEHGTPAADQTTPTAYIRPLTKVEEEQFRIAALNEALAEAPDFERCNVDGTPDPNGTHWKLRADPVA